MDDFFGVVLVIIAIISAISKNANKKKKAQAQSRQILTAVPKTKAVPQETKAVPMETTKAAPMAEESMLPPETPAEPAARQEIAPRVETRVRVSPHMEQYEGSMNAESTEGMDPCHEEQLGERPVPQLAPVPVETPGIRLEWTGENMVKSFIMQEVLQRPCDRRRRA